MPPPLSDAAMKSLTDALLAGRKIEAIKIYRELTGLGLRESKDEVEAIEARLRAQFPDKFPVAAQGKGCLTAVVMVALLIGGSAFSAYWFFKN
jgi:hypothetical protein